MFFHENVKHTFSQKFTTGDVLSVEHPVTEEKSKLGRVEDLRNPPYGRAQHEPKFNVFRRVFKTTKGVRMLVLECSLRSEYKQNRAR